MEKTASPNRLIHEKSPYLRQHADNPVDWYPWGDEAFSRAREENKPVFLSIGYSTCHWCHVMERESFENKQVAGLMNSFFVNIKVDREERPDIDNVYMTICQMMTGSGGWPLTIIMTPDKRPFYAATYIPRENRFGKIGMLELLPRINGIWENHRDEVIKMADRMVAALKTTTEDVQKGTPTETILPAAYDQLVDLFDDENGGFGFAPKFPSPQNLMYLLRYWKRNGSANALKMVEKTLHEMQRGGIYDHVGFGFHRYSVDRKWFLPHFEKMLYDQAMLSFTYTEAYQATGKKEYEKTAREVFSYVLDHMTAPGGGFYSAEDADSEGEEGKFYLWTEKEIEEIVDEKEADIILDLFGVEKDGNFSDEAGGRKTGRNMLCLKKTLAEAAKDYDLPEEKLSEVVESARRKLYSVRETRIHPLKDDKILTDWNGLMIAALAKGGQVFESPDYVRAAKKSADFILNRMHREDGRLLHRFKDDEPAILAHVDDYAFFIWGLIELYEATFDVEYLRAALKLNDEMIQYFWDGKDGGFYHTPVDGENLIVRQKVIHEGAIPSGNSIAMWNMLRLGLLSSDAKLLDRASQTGSAFFNTVRHSPAAYAQLMVAFDLAFGPSYEVVVAGISGAEDTKSMLRALHSYFIPNTVIMFRPTEEDLPEIAEIAEFTKDHKGIDGKATAYVCVRDACKLPTTDIATMLAFLAQ
jgi:uncharacterized protein YyaL (SSP411 family)